MTSHSRRRRHAAVAALGCLSLLAASCSSDPGTEDTTAAPSSASTSVPTSTAPLSPEDQAVADAQAIIPIYYETLARVASDPAVDINILYEAVNGEEIDRQMLFTREDRYQERRQIGVPTLVGFDTVSVDLTEDPTAQPPIRPTVVFDVCVDVSEVNVVDAEGRSVVLPDRPPTSAERLHVSQFDFGWRVAEAEVPGEPCADS